MIVNFTTRGATIVYQYQRLPNVHSTVANTFSFPAGLLNKPSGCELYFIAGSRIMWYFGMQSRNLFPLGNRDNGVLKKLPAFPSSFGLGSLLLRILITARPMASILNSFTPISSSSVVMAPYFI